MLCYFQCHEGSLQCFAPASLINILHQAQNLVLAIEGSVQNLRQASLHLKNLQRMCNNLATARSKFFVDILKDQKGFVCCLQAVIVVQGHLNCSIKDDKPRSLTKFKQMEADQVINGKVDESFVQLRRLVGTT